jgi:hypothetical protein
VLLRKEICDLIMIYFKEQYRTLSSILSIIFFLARLHKKIKIEKGIFFYFYFFLLIYDMNNETEYVKLISSDGFEFVIHREAAVRSGTIKNMLCGPGKTFI